ncbi:MAG: tetratricopeptide repeat protein [Candidatus Zixiibacteriota bacterium]|nr:MAG: tetratricopeptide repeat protein [candidate division Zixibacteria bacterium]
MLSERFLDLFGKIAKPGTPISGTPYKVLDIIGDRYAISGLLGQGGMGIVYLVYNKQTDGLTALKSFRDSFLEKDHIRSLFRAEVEAWVNLTVHPNVLQVLWVQEINGRLYVEMPLIPPPVGLERASLDAIIKRGPVDFTQALTWAIQFCRGMQHAYRHGIHCHLDIKPANLLIDESDSLLISDFGLAGLIRADDDVLMRPVGTPAYMPPEQFEGGVPGTMNDIYSFGLVLFEMIAGKHPFARSFGDATKPSAGTDTFNRWQVIHTSSSVPHVSGSIDGIIQKCLAKEPGERYMTFAQVAEELSWLRLTKVGKPETPMPPSTDEDENWTARGGHYEALGNYDKAISCYEEALSRDQDNWPAWNGRGICLYRLGRHLEAIECFKSAINPDSSEEEPWNNLGLAYNALGRGPEAIRCFQESIKIDRTNSSTWVNLGTSLQDSLRYQDALDCYDKGLQLDPNYAIGWLNRGNCLLELQRPEDATTSLRKALKIDPALENAKLSLAKCLMIKKDFQEALDLLHKLAQSSTLQAEELYNLGFLYEYLRSIPQAIECYTRFIQCDPPHLKIQVDQARQAIEKLKKQP